MTSFICNKCGSAAYFDGRMGDGPVLMCGCDESGQFVDDGKGGYYINDAKPVEGKSKPSKKDYSREDD